VESYEMTLEAGFDIHRRIQWNSPCLRGSVGSRTEKGLVDRYLAVRLTRYITNLAANTTSADEIVMAARSRCDQENPIAQLKGQVRALHAPVNTLVANWAYMVMTALAWSMKAWCALLVPVSPRWRALHEEQRRRLLTMEFATFRGAFIDIPCQIVTGGRQIRWRVLAWNPWLGTFFRLLDAI